MKAVLYVHGKGGNAGECERYKELFPEWEVTGLDYKGFTPWETGAEIREAVLALRERAEKPLLKERSEEPLLIERPEEPLLIANSIGAYFAMHAGIDGLISRAYFISPVVDMEALITGMMRAEGVCEDELRERGVIPTAFGEDLSWEYLSYVRSHPVKWDAPTRILYGSLDAMTPYETVRAFAEEHGAALTVMEGGEHWFHTEEQMRFLDRWISAGEVDARG